MAYVLSLRPCSPLKRSFSDNPYLQSCSSMKDAYFGPLSDITTCNISTCSIHTLDSNKTGYLAIGNENTPPLSTQSLLNLVPENDQHPGWHLEPKHTPRKRACNAKRPSPYPTRSTIPSEPYPRKREVIRDATVLMLHNVDLNVDTDSDDHNSDKDEIFGLYEAIHIPRPGDHTPNDDFDQTGNEVSYLEPPAASSQPFRRWLSTLRRRHAQRQRDPDADACPLSIDGHIDNGQSAIQVRASHPIARRMSESMSSSMGCIVTVKSASMTLASTSIAPRSDVIPYTSRNLRRSTFSEVRRSGESHRGFLGHLVDESAWLRSLQRRKIVEELISSEESYIADLKVLINDYFMILTALPALPSQMKTSIQQNISQILQLHEQLLAELQEIVPQADFTKSAQHESSNVTTAKHIRFHSADIIPGRLAEHKTARRLRHSLETGRSPDRRPRGLVTDTETVGNIAKIFNKHMKRFFTYEEYGAHWTTMSQDLTSMSRGLHGWQDYERGVEALQKMVSSDNNRDAGSRKALSFGDLLIKPIQRVCKYPLLFDDLCHHTPVYDDPEAHAELEKVLFRLQEAIREVNKAKDDPKARRLIEITWQLQDRLVFQEQSISRAMISRLLGHVLLCGVLYVTFQTPDTRMKGQYMICIMYKSSLVFATSNRFQTTYSVVASISLANSSIEESNDGRGVQCHTAPHTWKLVFEHGHRLYEVLLTACAAEEEEVWKSQLRERGVCETHNFVEESSPFQDMCSSMSIEMKSLGPVFGHADSLVRRMSVHRVATFGAKPGLSQVIIKNTQAQKLPDTPPTFSPSMIARSQSHMSTNHIPILAPRRAERIRLESVLEDVWTKDVLPFPGMSSRKTEKQIRTSANSVMRKLSIASIASNFSRRSPSFSSVSNPRSEDSFGSRVHKKSQGNLRDRSSAERRPAPAIVDFHTAPTAFLPTDFEIQENKAPGRRRRFANRAASTDRTSDTMTVSRPKRVRRLATHPLSSPPASTTTHSDVRLSLQRSSAVTIHSAAKTLVIPNSNQERDRPGSRMHRDCESRQDTTDTNVSRKFLKNKSRIFKFWV